MFFIKSSNFSGEDFKNILLNKHKIQLEMYLPHFALALTSISDTREGFLRLKKAVLEIDKHFVAEDDFYVSTPFLKMPKLSLTPREAFFAKKEEVGFGNVCGKVSGQFLIPYPPGVPLVVPGEIIGKETLLNLEEFAKNGIEILGSSTPLEKISLIAH